MADVSFPERIRAELVRAGMSQAELSRRTGISRPLINRYVKGTRKPNRNAIIQIALAVDVAPTHLAGDAISILQEEVDKADDRLDLLARLRRHEAGERHLRKLTSELQRSEASLLAQNYRYQSRIVGLEKEIEFLIGRVDALSAEVQQYRNALRDAQASMTDRDGVQG